MISELRNTVSTKVADIYQKSDMASASKAMRNILENVTKVAIPAILLFAASSAPGTEAGPIAYAACMAGCAAMPPVCAAGGWAACLAALAAPTP